MATTVTPSRSAAPADTGPDRAPFRRTLEVMRAECVRQRELALADTVASVPDLVAMARSAHLLNAIEEIDAALGRLEAGSYGRCVSCGSGIPAERLAFRPSAAACVRCRHRAA